LLMTDPILELLSELKKRMKNRLFLPFLFLFLYISVYSQNSSGEFSLIFYNVENLFDIVDDPLTMDEEFTPQGDRRWTYKRFHKKLIDISKVILGASGWHPPQLIALCEIENRYVLEKLLSDTPLQSFPYKIIHKESPDRRGIDVALIYNAEVFYPLEYKYIPIKTNNDSIIKTREILYVSGILNNTDTLHVFANHWPSRYSGLMETRSLRNLAANTLRNEILLVQQKHPDPKIVITGDFNDQPSDESMLVYLNAIEFSDTQTETQLYNLSFPWMKREIKTLKYQSQWMVFDQIIVSGSLLNENATIFTRPEWAEIVQLPFLLEKDEKYGGMKINRTYIGFRYNGGFSDHLPVLLKLQTNH
jgi:hypothetical protein